MHTCIHTNTHELNLIEMVFQSKCTDAFLCCVCHFYSDQVQLMGINPKVPFVKVRDIIHYYTQLSYMAQAQDQPQAKRSRIS